MSFHTFLFSLTLTIAGIILCGDKILGSYCIIARKTVLTSCEWSDADVSPTGSMPNVRVFWLLGPQIYVLIHFCATLALLLVLAVCTQNGTVSRAVI